MPLQGNFLFKRIHIGLKSLRKFSKDFLISVLQNRACHFGKRFRSERGTNIVKPHTLFPKDLKEAKKGI